MEVVAQEKRTLPTVNNCKLYHGDCLDVMSDIPDHSVDAIIADLPYGTTRCKWDSVIPFESLWKQYKRLIKKRGAIVLFGSQPFTSVLIMSNLEMFKYCLVWEKSRASNFVHANYQPLKAHEDLCIFSLGGSAQGSKFPMMYNPQYVVGKPYNKGYGHNDVKHHAGGHTQKKVRKLENVSGLRMPRSVIYFATADKQGGLHPTQKPVSILEYLIRTYTDKNDTVLDNTMGSGTTGVACVNTGRKFIGIDISQEYVDIARQRIYEAYEKQRHLTLF